MFLAVGHVGVAENLAMYFTTCVIVLLAINFGFFAGGLWASRDRERSLIKHQPLDVDWGDSAYYDRLTSKYRADGVL